MKKRKKGRRFNTSAVRQSPRQRTVELEPEELAIYVRRAEKEVLPIIKEMQLGPGTAQFLLAQQTQVLVTGDPRLTTERGWPSPITSWRSGRRDIIRPGPAYPYTLEEALLELQEGPKAKGNYEPYFQPFTPTNRDGIGEVAGGIVQHPETNLWQIWMMIDEPCTFIAAYRDPVKAQGSLEAISSASRKGGAHAKIAALYRQVQADGEPKQLLYAMMLYLL
jgi:hypothetical protein